MKFYDRETEITELRRLDRQSETVAQFTVLIGRRRIGKTTLLAKAFEGKPHLYFFVGRKSEQLLCQEYQHQMEEVLGLHIYGQITSFSALLREAFSYARTRQLTIIIDEFQRLAEVNESIISDLQDLWDRNHTSVRLHLIACGSIYSMMKKIFEDRKEPLFGRKTALIELKPFPTHVLKQIFRDFNPAFTPDDLLMLYAVTGGVAKYVAQLLDEGCRTRDDIIDSICRPSSIFLNEGTELLVGEFGRRYQIYYSILQLIANGMTSQAQIDGIVEKNTGRYLETLEVEYSLIHKLRPMWAKPNSQGVKYYINDNFLRFWFRFIETNRTMVEQDNYALLAEYIRKHYDQYSGLVLEHYFRQLYREQPRVSEVSHWWDSHGENEIDLIALERLDKRATIAEVKRNPQKFNPAVLAEKVQLIKPKLRGYDVQLIGLSLDDM